MSGQGNSVFRDDDTTVNNGGGTGNKENESIAEDSSRNEGKKDSERDDVDRKYQKAVEKGRNKAKELMEKEATERKRLTVSEYFCELFYVVYTDIVVGRSCTI